MNTTQDFRVGDRVVHASYPEWGVGRVESAEGITHEGARRQRLGVRFERAGLKTLSTAFADLRPAEEGTAIGRAEEQSGAGLIEGAAERSAAEVMISLPDAATDPFRPIGVRLRETLALYRFGGRGPSLLDWAAAQSGLRDPLSRFTRHELEDFYVRYERERDKHLKRLVEQARRSDPAALAEAVSKAPLEARNAVKRIDTRR